MGEENRRPVIGITMGDPAGIGPEVSVRAIGESWCHDEAIPILIGDTEPVEDAIRFCKLPLDIHRITVPEEALGRPGILDLLAMDQLSGKQWQYGQVSAVAGNAGFQYVKRGIALAMEGRLSAVVTGPINKEALNLAGHHFSGHTEIFAEYTGTRDYAMMLTAPGLRVIHVTTHESLRNACDQISISRVHTVIRLAHQALRDMGIQKPRIGVAGLNPHSSENGLFGKEEEQSIFPAIRQAQEENILADGPVPPDTVFVKALGGQYDVVVAMYHDQGHIPLKLVGFRTDQENHFSSVEGVNLTVGLPIIRTSVDHGTAFDKAGKWTANGRSMADACQMAVTLAKNRRMHRL